MGIQEIVSSIQAGAITVAFLYITFQVPSMLKNWLISKEKLVLLEQEKDQKNNKHWGEERRLDREARHESNSKFQEILAEVILEHKQSSDKINETLGLIQLTMREFCRYQLPVVRPKPPQGG